MNKPEKEYLTKCSFFKFSFTFAMKNNHSYLWLIALVLLITSCNGAQTYKHYELTGGDPEIDYIDFLNDTMCQFVAPGPLTITRRYVEHENMYEIHINDMVRARLHKRSDRQLQGEAPFFEGTWNLKEK